MKTKRELVQICADKIRECWRSGERTSKKAYEECREICAKNGVVGGAYHQVWIMAGNKRQIEDNGRLW